MTNSIKDLQYLLAEHAKLWEADCAAWRAFGNISELEEIRKRPPLRVQIGSNYLGRDDDNQDINEPRYFSSEKQAKPNIADGQTVASGCLSVATTRPASPSA